MAWALVQAADVFSGSASSVAKAYTSNNTSGNLLVAFVHYFAATGTITGVSDPTNGSWTSVGVLEQGNSSTSAAFYVPSCAATGSPITVTAALGQSSASPALVITEWSGVATGSPFDVAAGNTGSIGVNNPASSGAITTTTNGDLIIASFYGSNESGNFTIGTGFTSLIAANGGFCAEYKTQTTAGAITPQVTPTTGTYNFTAISVSFKPSAGGGGGGSNPTTTVVDELYLIKHQRLS